MISIVVLTCPREGRFDYYADTIAALERERAAVDFGGVTVCDNSDDEAMPEPTEKFPVFSFKRPAGTLRGNKLAYWEALARALDASDGDALIFEDDVELCTNALRRMATFPVPPDCDFLMFFSPAVLQGAKSYPGLWRTPTPVMGCQAIKFTRRTLARLISWGQSLDFQKFTASDQALELARVLLGMKYAAHCPELVQHVGESSAVSPGWTLESYKHRRALTYSRDLDAMALYARDDLYR